MRKRVVIILSSLILASIGTYCLFLFAPYFYDVNKNTNSINHLVYGYQLGYGFPGQSDVKINGNLFLFIAQICGPICFICLLTFLLWFIFSKKKNSPMMYFLLGVSMFCISLVVSSLFLSWPIYQSANASRVDNPIFTWQFFLSIGSVIVGLIINAYLIIYIAMNKRKRV